MNSLELPQSIARTFVLAENSVPADVVGVLFEMFATLGGRRYGEDVTQAEHMLQCAVFAAEDQGEEALVVAALLHDVGHFLHAHGEDAAERGVDDHHERLGAAWTARWFGPDVAAPIALHVAAKRYLCGAEPGYLDSLSAASRLSLSLQGGVMTPDEGRRFLGAPHARNAIRLRRYDDRGKLNAYPTPPIEAYGDMLMRQLRSQAAARI